LSPNASQIESEACQLLAALKELLRERRISYPMIAEAMDISLPTVKRMLNKPSLPLDRLMGVCRVAGIEPTEVFTRAERQRPTHTVFTAEQDELFDLHPEFLSYLSRLVNDGKTPAEIQDAEGISPDSTERYLIGLAKVGLLERDTGTRVKLKVSSPLGFGPDSRVLRKIQGAFMTEIVERVLGGETDGVHALMKPLFLRRDTYRELVGELRAIVDKYSYLSSRIGEGDAGEHFKLAVASGVSERPEQAPIVDLK
jgi:hypothetical protein